MIENDDSHEKFEVREVMSYDVMWTPGACLWPQKHSGNMPGWFRCDFEASENFRNCHDFDPDFDTKVLQSKPILSGFG